MSLTSYQQSLTHSTNKHHTDPSASPMTMRPFSPSTPSHHPSKFPYTQRISSHFRLPSNLKIGANADIEHMCAGVVHPTTGEAITSYKKLIVCPLLREVWSTAFGKEFGNLAQGDNKTGEKGTSTMFAMTHTEIRNIPREQTITYGQVVVDYRPQKEDPNCVRITAGSNLIKDYPGELTTCTADLTASKILWNSVLSTKNAKFMGLGLKSFYLTVMLD
eukprot:CCRYP_008237-RA/>CCRYP_008237-RA protein AED:0.41 eAED:0.41 QI:0/0/0/1/0/0/2/0/217